MKSQGVPLPKRYGRQRGYTANQERVTVETLGVHTVRSWRRAQNSSMCREPVAVHFSRKKLPARSRQIDTRAVTIF
jgi:uncharacterized sporulation protein YeaH/YhbH (DUF444 family)